MQYHHIFHQTPSCELEQHFYKSVTHMVCTLFELESGNNSSLRRMFWSGYDLKKLTIFYTELLTRNGKSSFGSHISLGANYLFKQAPFFNPPPTSIKIQFGTEFS